MTRPNNNLNLDKKIAYFATGLGSGQIMRGIALYKAAIRAGLPASNITLIAGGPYSWLLNRNAPGANLLIKSSAFATEYQLATAMSSLDKAGNLPDVFLTSYHIDEAQTVLGNN